MYSVELTYLVKGEFIHGLFKQHSEEYQFTSKAYAYHDERAESEAYVILGFAAAHLWAQAIPLQSITLQFHLDEDLRVSNNILT